MAQARGSRSRASCARSAPPPRRRQLPVAKQRRRGVVDRSRRLRGRPSGLPVRLLRDRAGGGVARAPAAGPRRGRCREGHPGAGRARTGRGSRSRRSSGARAPGSRRSGGPRGSTSARRRGPQPSPRVAVRIRFPPTPSEFSTALGATPHGGSPGASAGRDTAEPMVALRRVAHGDGAGSPVAGRTPGRRGRRSGYPRRAAGCVTDRRREARAQTGRVGRQCGSPRPQSMSPPAC